jgi:hypothetical protein
MKGLIGGVINIIFFPFRLIGSILGLAKKQVDFINVQLKLDKQHEKQRHNFLKTRKKLFRDNDELI